MIDNNYSTSDVKTFPWFNLPKSIASGFIKSKAHPWEIFPGLANYIYKLGASLPPEDYDEISEGVWVHRLAYMAASAKFSAPVIVCSGAKICHNSYISSSIIGAYSTIGNCSFVENSITFDLSKLCANNCISNCIIGYNATLGFGVVAPDFKLDWSSICVSTPDGLFFPGANKLGSLVGECCKIGSNCVLNPGSIVDDHTLVFPLCSISGYTHPFSIIKGDRFKR